MIGKSFGIYSRQDMDVETLRIIKMHIVLMKLSGAGLIGHCIARVVGAVTPDPAPGMDPPLQAT